MKIRQLILFTTFSFLYNFTAYTQSIINEKDSIFVSINSCGCFLDSSNGQKIEICYFTIYNRGKNIIHFPQQLTKSIFFCYGSGLMINHEIFYVNQDTIDISKMYEVRNHPKYKIDKRVIELRPMEEYYVHLILSDIALPYNGKYRVRFSIEPENGNFGTKGLKKSVYSRWIELEWTYSKQNFIKHP
jgi:hypothetical protein